MANVPLKSIQFPGLDDVYTVTQLANNLTSAGKAADSKVVGDAVSEIRSAITPLQSDVESIKTTLGNRTVTAHFSASAFEACYPINTNTGIREYSKYSTSVASNDTFFNFQYQVEVTSDVENDYQFVCYIYDVNGDFVTAYDYTATASGVTIPAGTNFRLQIRKKNVNPVDVADVNAHLYYSYYQAGIVDDVEDLQDEVEAIAEVAEDTPLDPSDFETCYPIDGNTGIRSYDKYSTGAATNDTPYQYPLDVFIVSDATNGYEFSVYEYGDDGVFILSTSYVETAQGWTVPAGIKFRLAIRKYNVAPTDVADVASHIYICSDAKKAIYTSKRLAERFTDDIVDRNSDMLDAVNAASLYGVHISGVQNKNKVCSLLVTADLHWGINRLTSALIYQDVIDSIDMGCCLGDIQAGNYAESNAAWYTSRVNACQKPFFTVIGNHDCGNGTSGTTSGTTAEVVAKFITPVEAKAGQSGLTVPYYSYDDDTYHIHFIVLYNYDSPDTKDGSGNFLFYRGGECYSQNQLDWLANDLNSVQDGYSVVILMHSYWFPNTAVECNFSQKNAYLTGNGNTSGYDGDDNIIPKIINAYMTRGTIDETFAPKSDYSAILPTLEADYDFTNANGTFICYLVGHSHKDVVAHSTQYQNQLAIGFCATASDLFQNGASDLPRTLGTRSEDAITVVAFDTVHREVHMVRIGSNVTTHMGHRNYISIPY